MPADIAPTVQEEGEEEGAAKKRPKLDRAVDKWVFTEFNNPARTDAFKPLHWTKEKEQGEPYQFARFNRKTTVVTYTPEEYKSVVEPMDA